MRTAAKTLGVRLNLSGEQEQSTSTVATSVSPRWLKDFKMHTPGGAGDAEAVLNVALFDGETNKTLASSSFTLKEVVETGLIRGRWVELTDMNAVVAAEVCLRLKFEGGQGGISSKSSQSSLAAADGYTGSGSGRAGAAPEGAADDSGNMSREDRAKAREARAKSRDGRPKSEGDRSRSRGFGADQSKEREGREGTVPVGSTKKYRERGVSRDRGTSRERGTSRDRRSRRGGARGGRGGGGFTLPKLKLPTFSAPDLGAIGDVFKGLVKEVSPGGLLAAAAGIFLVGNFSKIRGPPRYYEVQEGDSLCTIAGCYNKEWSELLDKNADTIVDPNVIYPGDRIRLS